MKNRTIIAISVMLSGFGLFLYWLYSTGSIGETGMALLITSGIILVTTTNFIYKRLWNDDE